MFSLQAVEMQTRYIELFTLSGDYYKYLGAMQKNMEELKVTSYVKYIPMVFKLNLLQFLLKLKCYSLNVYYIKHSTILTN